MKTIVRKALACMLAVLVLFSAVSVAAAAETAEQFEFAGANMTLGNELVLNFMIDASEIGDPDAYTAIVTHAGQTAECSLEQYSPKYYSVSYGVAAKEMADEVSVYVVDADGSIVSETYTRSIKDYAETAIASTIDSDTAVATLMVEMLNYGAEAQAFFGYNEAQPANADLTEEQQALSGEAAACENGQIAGEKAAGANLSLEERILLNMYFERGTDAVEDMSAVVSFEDYRGNEQTAEVAVTAHSAALCRVTVDQVVLADARQDVSVKVYAADGSLYGETVDSVESYVARTVGTDMDALSAAVMKFSDAARVYLLGRDAEEEGGEGSADVVVGEDGTVKDTVSISGGNAQATVPAGVTVKDGTTSLVLSVRDMEESGADVELGENETSLSLNVHVDGVAEENTTAILVTLGEILPVGLNKSNIALYHVEDGETVEMTRVLSMEELDAHNEYYYDPATGIVTVALASFSEIMLVNEEAKWEGDFDDSWYDADATELKIANADQLAAFGAIVGGMNGQTRDSFAGKTIKLVNDIVIGETDGDNMLVFYPIGYYNNTGLYEKVSGKVTVDGQQVAVSSGFKNFEGIFDGNGHTISDWYHNTWEMFGDYNDGYSGTPNHNRDGMGLFGRIYGGTVKNLTVKNFTSDGEFATTGVIAAYADCEAAFENIAIVDCNPRVYNIGNGGIVGCVGWYAMEATSKPVTFKNITVDNSNKITALWGSWDVACGGLVGQYYPTSGQSSAGYPTNGGISFDNCHVAAQIDVYNDVCANYQYYAYRYSGMMIGSIRENITGEDGHVYPKMDGITAKGCTVHFGDWNDYYYCELVANTLASYTHDHQMSRLEQVADVDVENKTVTYLNGTTAAIPAGRVNYVVVTNKNDDGMWIHGDGKDYATCYHFVDGNVWDHADAGEETVDGAVVLKEDKQLIYREFDQLFTGYGWGVTSKGLTDFEGITNLDIKHTEEEESVTKFEYVGQDSYITGEQLYVGNLFARVDDCQVAVDYDNVQVFVSPADETSTVSAVYAQNKAVWGMGTLTFSGLGRAVVTITDYYFCTPTVIEIEITEDDRPADAKSYTVDFKQFARDIAAQELWNDLPHAITQEWLDSHTSEDQKYTTNPMSAETRFIGRFYEPKIELDKYLWGDTEKAAYDSIIEYQKANYNWYWYEPTTRLKTVEYAKGMFVNCADNVTWGISLYSGPLNSTGSNFNFAINVEEAGAYDLDLTAYYEGLTGAANIVATTGGGSGSGYIDILVNGKHAVNDYCLLGTYENGRINATMPNYMATVYLREGENIISLRPAKDMHGTESHHRRQLNLVSVTFTEANCAHETITDYYCETCGQRFVPEDTYLIDFKDFAKQASVQAWWNDLGATAHEDARYLGYELKAMDATNKAAYTAMQQWLSENACWNFDEEVTGFTTTLDRKHVYLNASDAMTWGLAYFSTYFNCDAAKLGITVNVEKAGAYQLDMTAFYEGTTSNFNTDQVTGGGDGQPGVGGGYADIFVNGRLIADDHRFYPDNQQSLTQKTTLANVWLEAGENTITVVQAKDHAGNLGSTSRRFICLKHFALTPVECDHSSNAFTYATNYDLTHTETTSCDNCGKFFSEAVKTCTDDNGDYFCDLCGGAVIDESVVFQIAAKDDLITFSKLVKLGATELDAELTADIVLSDVNIAEAETPSATAQTDCWIYLLTTDHAIGTAEQPYSGTFNGNGHTISGLNIYYSNVRAALGDGKNDNLRDFRLGLFGTTDGATIKDLTVEGGLYLHGRLSDYSKIAGIVACATDTVITDCFNRVKMAGRSSGTWAYQTNVGGIVGLADGCTVTRCGNEADLMLSGRYMGGLVGHIAVSDVPTVIDRCYNVGDIDGCREVGGLVGQVGGCTNAETPTKITNCYSYGNFDNHFYGDDSTAKYTSNYSGGLFGGADTLDNTTKLYTEIGDLLLSGGTKTTLLSNDEPIKNAICRSWPSIATPTKSNLYYDNSKGVEANTTGSNYWGEGVSPETLATAAFVEGLSEAFVLRNGEALPVLAWQCSHETEERIISNGNGTHDVVVGCTNCTMIERVSEDDAECTDEDLDKICDICGVRILPEGTYVLDFKKSMKKASEQDFWQDLHTVTGSLGSSKFVGIRGWGRDEDGTQMTEVETNAYHELLDYMDRTFGWTINEETTPFIWATNEMANKAVVFNTDDAVKWGLSYLSGGFDTEDSTSKMDLAVTVVEAGWYAIDLTAFHEANYGNITVGPYTGILYSGSGYAEILVNGNAVMDEYAFSGLANEAALANQTANVDVGYAWFNAGKNIITINTTKDTYGETENMARTISLQSMTLVLVEGDECPVCQGEGEDCVTCATKPNDGGEAGDPIPEPAS
ncbi:MAG: hypothetical protein IJO88_08155 [Oscillospiraceae bacterium]|nr:hypothetical protein [Oscillospiraceae bacterium]